jgi:hypothetical protein
MSQWSTGDDPNSIRQEVLLQISSHHEDCVEQLLYLHVPCLSILKDLTDKIHRLLLNIHHGLWSFNCDDGADNYISGCDV